MKDPRRGATLHELVRELRLRRALEGLEPGEAHALEELTGESADAPPDAWERAAAAAHLALVGRGAASMPDRLRTRLVESARTILSPSRGTDTPH